jgi:isopentenyl diphosphate isomerase/L-lactate dehydrogenase-like FMN-dependent dehydrogenase
MAPVGVQGLFHEGGERALSEACMELGIPYTLSTAATSTIEDIGTLCGDYPHWYQLYWPKDDSITASLLRRAKTAGFSTLVVTLDTPSVGWRPEDLDSANMPFLKGVGNAIGFSDPVFRARFAEENGGKTPEDDRIGASELWIDEVFGGEHHSWEDLDYLRQHWSGPIVLKGIQSVEDARQAVKHGIDGIIVSNHGGRQVDGAVASLDVLPDIVSAVEDDTTVMFDSGIRTGSDILKALALGAKAAFVGRPALYGLGIAGKEGAKAVLAGLLAELDQTMGIAGFRSIDELSRQLLKYRCS